MTNPKIKVVGVGGSGSNTISRMAKYRAPGIDLIAINTDAQALYSSKAGKITRAFSAYTR